MASKSCRVRSRRPKAISFARAVGINFTRQSHEEDIQRVCEECCVAIAGPLASSQDVVVLTDIAAILESGPAWKNTISHLLGRIADFLDPGGLTWRTLHDSWLG